MNSTAQSVTASHFTTSLPLASREISANQTLPGVLQSRPVAADGPITAAYLHIPFCFHKCHYCDFYSIVDSRDRQAAFTDRLIDEIASVGEYLTHTSPVPAAALNALFIGGGTPTLLKPDLWTRLRRAITDHLPVALVTEFTVEANPETVTPELARALTDPAHGLAVNRVSIGAQSFNPAHLKTLERWHDPDNVSRSMMVFRNAGIDHINLDLICAIPGQTLDDWRRDLDAALALNPTHLSCYNLMYETGTALTAKLNAGRITRTDQDLEADMYEHTLEYLAASGFEHYEISNWARRSDTRDYRCQHNLAYWRNENWLALGPSASGHINGLRWKNVPRLTDYLTSAGFPPVTDVEYVDEDTRIGEQFMLGMRLLEGLARATVDRLLAHGDRSATRRAAIARRVRDGLLIDDSQGLRLTPAGCLTADSVIADLL